MSSKLLMIALYIFLFYSCSDISKEENERLTKIEVLEKAIDFGKIKVSDSVTHVFKIKNITNVDLKIKKIGTSCGCTSYANIDSVIKKK